MILNPDVPQLSNKKTLNLQRPGGRYEISLKTHCSTALEEALTHELPYDVNCDDHIKKIFLKWDHTLSKDIFIHGR